MLCTSPNSYATHLIFSKNTKQNSQEFSLFGILLLYILWEYRNKVLHSGHEPDLFSFLSRLTKLFHEHRGRAGQENKQENKWQARWNMHLNIDQNSRQLWRLMLPSESRSRNSQEWGQLIKVEIIVMAKQFLYL